jgi:hypothetical protein
VKPWDRYQARRRRKVREAYEQEKARQKALNERDTLAAMRWAADNSAFAQTAFWAQ